MPSGDEILAIAGVAAAVLTGGIIRGLTGFGGAMAIAPMVSVILGPVTAVVLALSLETLAAATMLPGALRLMRLRTIAPIGLAAMLTIPAGTWLLVSLDPGLLRRIIAGMVVVFVVVLGLGVRYTGEQRLSTSVGLGAVSGALVGATSMGAPPVILYLLAGPDPIATTRANLVVFITFISGLSVLSLAIGRVIDRDDLLWTIAMAPLFLAATWAGGRIFERLGDRGFRRWALALLLLLSAPILLL